MQDNKAKLLIAWAAGFFDGEGSVHICYTTKDGYSYPQVAISQSGFAGYELLAKFDKAVGYIGRIFGPFKPAKCQKQIRWMWEASGVPKTKYVFQLLKPHLGTVKIEKFQLVLQTTRKD